MRPTLVLATLPLLIAACARSAAPVAAPAPTAAASPLDAALAAGHRSAEARARDVYRHPKETLSFCGLQPGTTVVELAPGGGWYTEILAPVLARGGQLVAAPPSAEGPSARYRQALLDRFAADPEVFEAVRVGTFDPPQAVDVGAPGSADLVLTFRSTHGWINRGVAADAYAAVFEVLRPGGTFCVVQHRAPEGEAVSPEERAKTGYVPQSYVIALAERAGFVLDASSEINANPADTRDHPEGVWTLPPVLRLGDQDRERYVAIGESDRMTLRFRKPE